MGRATYATGLTLVIALLWGCGGSGDDDAAPTTVRAPLTCTSEEGLTFTTELASCGEALSRGREFAAELGLATGPDTPAAEHAMATTCSTIQGTQPKTYESPEFATLADQLHTSGVCPGVITMLVPPTTAPVVGLVVTSGWTLVEVIDGDTFDVTGTDGQRRIQIIGINAPEPGGCMSDQATNALRLLASDKELTLVPDMSDVDADGNNLRYVEQSDGVDLGGTMIDLGLAIAEPVEPDIARGGQYAQRMVDAQTAAVGMWAADACPVPATIPPATTPPTTTGITG
ncbi:MAG TPA: thermonuclease family protein [Ilumatobacter sp.]|nr:thermonuclease family protein [Ilumatobacter sp.]